MRKTLRFAVMAAVLCSAAPSFAQNFANRSIGLSVSVQKLLGPSIFGVDLVVPIALEGGMYLENGFEIYLRPQFFITQVLTGAKLADGTVGPGIVVGGGGQFGVRYLFLEESIRPYVGLHLAVLILGTAPSILGAPGVGANVGCDFFVSDSVSLGVRVPVDLYLRFNVSGSQSVVPNVGIGGTIYATTYF